MVIWPLFCVLIVLGHLLFVLNVLCLIATVFKFSGMLLLVFSVLLAVICCWVAYCFGLWLWFGSVLVLCRS